MEQFAHNVDDQNYWERVACVVEEICAEWKGLRLVLELKRRKKEYWPLPMHYNNLVNSQQDSRNTSNP